MAGYRYVPRGGVARFVQGAEETVIAILLGAMTLLTFVNVVLRYLFNASLIWSLEVVLVLFSWLVLFGIAYGFKVTAHLGVDAVTNLFSGPNRRLLGLLSTAICLVYAALILKGAWDYWAPFADLPKTTGRWFPTGFDWDARRYGFTETGQIPIPFDWLQSLLERMFNSYEQDGERLTDTYAKLPVAVPYLILPIAAALMALRIVQAGLRIWRGDQDSLIVSHEAEEAVEDVAALNRET